MKTVGFRAVVVGSTLLVIAACGEDGSTSAHGAAAEAPPISASDNPTPATPIEPDKPAPTPELPSCARKDVTHGAPIALFDAFATEIKTLNSQAAKMARVDKLLADVAAQGGTPLEDPKGARVVFLSRDASIAKVAGSFVAWDASKAALFTQVEGTDLRTAETTIPHGNDSFEYKLLAAGDTFVEDPLATNVIWDGIDRGFAKPGEMNGVGHPGDAAMDRGRMVSLGKRHATKLGDDRDVWVYYPAAYDDSTSSKETCKKLPSILFHDGKESLTRGGFAKEAEKLYAARPDLAAVLVFVGLPNQDVRMDQYTFASAGTKGPEYVDFLLTDLWPVVSKQARVCGKPAARGISGASLGGLISTYSAFEHPEQWGWIGSQSGSYFWADDAMITRATNEAKKPGLRIYLDSGCPDDNCVVNDELASVLQQKGYDFVRIKKEGAAHDWSFWRDRLAGMLTHFRDKQTVCD